MLSYLRLASMCSRYDYMILNYFGNFGNVLCQHTETTME